MGSTLTAEKHLLCYLETQCVYDVQDKEEGLSSPSPPKGWCQVAGLGEGKAAVPGFANTINRLTHTRGRLCPSFEPDVGETRPLPEALASFTQL